MLNNDPYIHWIICKNETENETEYQDFIDTILNECNFPFLYEYEKYYFKNVNQFVKFLDQIQARLPFILNFFSHKITIFCKIKIFLPYYDLYYNQNKIDTVKKICENQK
jgi:hypothetical protein